MEEPDELDTSILHIWYLAHQIEETFHAFKHVSGKIDKKIELRLFTVTCQVMIISTCSFLDEYDNFLKSEESDVIREIKLAVKPAMKVIRQWRNLEDFRNNVLAHNLRVRKEGNVSVFIRGISSYDVPQTASDMNVLYTCITSIKRVFESAFGARIDNAIDYFKIIFEKKYSPRYDKQSSKQTITDLIKEINVNIKKLKDKYGA
jgi:hypothetical protein